LLNGVVGTVEAGTSAQIQSLANGWYRCTVTRTLDTGTWYPQVAVATGNGVFSYLGDGTSGIYIWGAQLEAGSVATSYIPNPTSGSLVRSADGDWDITGAAFTALWGAGSERTIIVEWWDTGAATYDVFVAHASGSIAESIGLYVSSGNIKYRARDGGSDQIDLTVGTVAVNGRNKCAFSFGAGAFAASRNGATSVTGTGTIPTPTHGRISGDQLYAGPVQDILTSTAFRPTALTGAALQALSAL
jgi:hypothetical protein